MRNLPNSVLLEYVKSINGIAQQRRAELYVALKKLDYSNVTDAVNRSVELMEVICGISAEQCAALSATFYDAICEAQTGAIAGAATYASHDGAATGKAVRSFATDLVKADQDIDGYIGKCMDRVSYESKRAAGETIMRNASKSGGKVKYARVPTGAETCQFCLMLASRGFVYANKWKAGEGSHYHANCDCAIVPSFDGSGVEGYDPDQYEDMWRNPDKYPELREARNARARELYAQKKRDADAS